MKPTKYASTPKKNDQNIVNLLEYYLTIKIQFMKKYI